ncbi:lytic transglycosylase domain-containing protein [Escherichia coli]|uniref:Lytic transglycosylase domain-containing protein n=1 Tax=Klebsiella variicola TaxID=244366 RepID=A0A7H0EV73_KLEVA|nr:lytic transglycosylase domain-containing protein [Klebsiella variicola]EGM5348164.1 lytic transglycosylase domain-containing protein [Salmonella enterica]EIL0849649.1 lytic transglycosylase domain-containing protein [Escherichia coli]EGN9175440.1 lytic transglycosylase domain-containing protein [Salmonella enterica]ELH4482543.1 lytic transglycosylase domain-containing protein [Salmonella enterica]QNP27689.1 lytic transglycosylase domain-containing protein [Klebsiella variicola]
MVLAAPVLASLLMQCGGNVDPTTLQTIISVESDGNPYVVANVTKNTSHYFKSKDEAVHFVNELAKVGDKYSVGLGQIYVDNFKGYGLTNETAFDFCKNVTVASKIFEQCYYRAIDSGEYPDEQQALRAAASCYYSNNFTRGFKKEKNGKSYIDLANNAVNKIYSVPAMKPVGAGDSLTPVNNNLRRGIVYQQPEGDQPEMVESAINVKGNKPARAAWDVFNDFAK